MTIERRLLDFDQATGIAEWYNYDHATGDITVESTQDVQAIVEHTKRLANDTPSGFKKDMHRVASIPLTVWMELEKQGIAGDQKALRKWLNDRDNLVFRTHHGRL